MFLESMYPFCPFHILFSAKLDTWNHSLQCLVSDQRNTPTQNSNIIGLIKLASARGWQPVWVQKFFGKINKSEKFSVKVVENYPNGFRFCYADWLTATRQGYICLISSPFQQWWNFKYSNPNCFYSINSFNCFTVIVPAFTLHLRENFKQTR